MSEEKTAELSLTEKIFAYVKSHKLITTLGVLALIVGVAGWGAMSTTQANQNEERVKALRSQNPEASNGVSPTPDVAEGVDALLMEQQPVLRERYGPSPEGFIWDTDGTLLSLGKKDVNPEDVVYLYLRALNTLDFDTAEFYSRRSVVVGTYRDFFDQGTSASTDAAEQFSRNLYRNALLSLQVKSVSRSANFSDNKAVYTVSAQVIDLTDKTFWLKDKETIFKSLMSFSSAEDDNTKVDQFLYDYLTRYYTSQVNSLGDPQKASEAKMRTVTFDLTLQKFPAQDSGWLVSIDKDLQLIASNSDIVSPVDHIKTQFQDYKEGVRR